MSRRFLWGAVALLIFTGLLAYSNSFGVPFQWDDKVFIKDNYLVRDLGFYSSPSSAQGVKYSYALKNRYVGYLSFALNYRLHGFGVWGYHAVNLAVHILNALLVFALIALTFRTPAMRGSRLKGHSGHVALMGALLFIAHPVQTEAVTYIFQRLASLAALFYLLSMVAYVRSRLSVTPRGVYGFYILSLMSAVLAMKTKENTFTLPLAVALYELYFFKGGLKQRLLALAPMMLTLFIIPLSIIGTDRPPGEILAGLGSIPRGYDGITRGDYLITELRVLATYLRLLVWPVGQNVDYDYPVFSSLLDSEVIGSVVLLAGIIASGAYLLIRSKTGEPALRLASYGIFWFFLTLSVESGLVPLPTIINEYRLYLPSVGVAAGVAAGAFHLALTFFSSARARRTQRARRAAFALGLLVVYILAGATFSRNSLWRTETALWLDTVRKSPMKARPHNNLGLAYLNKGDAGKAVEFLDRAIELEPAYAIAYANLGNAYVKNGMFAEALDSYQRSLVLMPHLERTRNNLGNVYVKMDRLDEAASEYRRALGVRPDFAEAHNNLGLIHYYRGETEAAIREFQLAVQYGTSFANAHFNLGNAYAASGRIKEAADEYWRSLLINPNNAEARNNLGTLYAKDAQHDKALAEYRKALAVKPDHASAHFNIGLLFTGMGFTEEAEEAFKRALELDPKLREKLPKDSKSP